MRPTLEVLTDLAQKGFRIEIEKAPRPDGMIMITLSAGPRHYRRYIERSIFERTETVQKIYERALVNDLLFEAFKILDKEAKQ